MVDQFASITELMEHTIEGKDWEIITTNRDSEILVTAVHGGAIERGTSELAQLIAEEGAFNYYTFKAIRSNHNDALHVTSSHFDEPILHDMVKNSSNVLSIHGCNGKRSKVYMGGQDQRLGQRIEAQLRTLGVEIEAAPAPAPINGKSSDNFVNQGQTAQGVQIELTVPLRKQFFNNGKYGLKDRENRDNWNSFMHQFAACIVKAMISS
ncbi:poly-gamma-glutamate hydrolase family protein [Staphylococcus auricularis]|uniref:poly-gamma-glutamate hydrolase family protein n=1 Tax=Staphylococcus auricularis TaxID=29379 RepID=UPI00242BC041|nr:poly-gamma-glutamate hydrolase family protein [Staphylococcus auricularis]